MSVIEWIEIGRNASVRVRPVCLPSGRNGKAVREPFRRLGCHRPNAASPRPLMKTMGATMKTLSLASVLRRGALMTALMAPQIALAQDKATTLFKVITVKDEI